MIEERIHTTKQYVKTLFADRADGHDVEHILRVYTNAMRIAQAEGPCDMEIVGLSALLHDADDDKLFQTENNANARTFLEEICIPQNQIDQICQDADRLDAIGAVGIARTFSYGGHKGRPLTDTVQHFHDKLLLLKDEMNTETAKQMAESRHQFLITFLNELEKE